MKTTPKINRKEIMTNAWSLVRTNAMTISAALKQAWAVAKGLVVTAQTRLTKCGRNAYNQCNNTVVTRAEFLAVVSKRAAEKGWSIEGVMNQFDYVYSYGYNVYANFEAYNNDRLFAKVNGLEFHACDMNVGFGEEGFIAARICTPTPQNPLANGMGFYSEND